MIKRLKDWLRPAVYLGNNPISLAGAILTTSTAVLLIAFWIYMFLARRPVLPYNGIVFFFIVPALFILGLLLMPIGGLLRRRRLKKEGKLPHVYPTIDLRQPMLQRALAWVVFLTFVNASLMGVATYKAIEHMDTVEFCGQTCHTVMAP